MEEAHQRVQLGVGACQQTIESRVAAAVVERQIEGFRQGHQRGFEHGRHLGIVQQLLVTERLIEGIQSRGWNTVIRACTAGRHPS